MTRPAFLLDHEDLCPVCKGEKQIECSGVHPSRPAGGVSVMETPDCWTEECGECGGRGVVLNERREFSRDSGSPLVEAFRKVRAQLDVARLTIEEQALTIERLKSEQRDLRSRVTGVGVAHVRRAS